jgi:hypothetical protein
MKLSKHSKPRGSDAKLSIIFTFDCDENVYAVTRVSEGDEVDQLIWTSLHQPPKEEIYSCD